MISTFSIFHQKRSIDVKNIDPTDEALPTFDAAEPEGNVGCQVRRKIEDYLERRRYQDELGDFDMEMS